MVELQIGSLLEPQLNGFQTQLIKMERMFLTIKTKYMKYEL